MADQHPAYQAFCTLIAPITATEVQERREAIRGRHDPTPIMEPLVARAIQTLRQAAQDVINDKDMPQAAIEAAFGELEALDRLESDLKQLREEEIMQTTKRELLEERLEKRCFAWQSYAGDSDLPDSEIMNCIFREIPQTDDCIFSVTQIPEEDGFHVRMKGLKIMPATHTSFSKFPKWLVPVVKLLGAKV